MATTRPTRPAAAMATTPATATSVPRARVAVAAGSPPAAGTVKPRVAVSSSATAAGVARPSSSATASASTGAVAPVVAAASASSDESRDFTPMSTGSARPPSSSGGGGSTSARRVNHASSTASSILRDHNNDSDDDNDANGEGMGRRLNLKAVILASKAEAAAAAKEAAANQTPGEAEEAAARANVPILAGAPDVQGPPRLPAQHDEDNELYYCPRLTQANLQRITGEHDLTRVTKLSLHLNTEEQELGSLNVLLPSLQELNLIPPSFVSSFRDFGRSLVRIRKLSLPSAGLTDLDGIEFLTQLVELRARGNIISDLSPLMFAPTLRVLDLAGNKIKERDMIEFIGVCTDLRELELEGNPISMCVHYRSVVASRCTDIPSFTLDGVPVTDAERGRRSEQEESLVDRPKLRAWHERMDRADGDTSGGSQAALQRKMATADFNTLTSGVRPQDRSVHASQANSRATSPTRMDKQADVAADFPASDDSVVMPAVGVAPPASRPAGPALSSSLGSSGSAAGGSSALSSAARKREYQRFLDSKESSMRGDPASAAARRAQEKHSAVADIMRLENEMHEDQASGVAKDYLNRMAEQQTAARNPAASHAAVPRLQFDAAFNANASPSPSPVASSGPLSFGAKPAGVQHQLSLSTPRPGTSSGGRPGSSSGNRPGTASGLRDGDDSQPDSSSNLTYGSDAIMAGNYAQAMRARKKQGSISLSGGASLASDESRSPSSTGRSHHTDARPASPVPSVRIPSTPSYPMHPIAASSSSSSVSSSQPSIVFRKSGGGASPPVIPTSAGSASPGQQPSRPLVMGSGGSMLARHMASTSGAGNGAVLVGSPLAAARASQAKSQDEVVFTIGKKPATATATASATLQPGVAAAARSTTGKTYTLVRTGSNKK